MRSIVLDEADTLLNFGDNPEVEWLLDGMVSDYQLVLASAVWVETLLESTPTHPFSDDEMAQLTEGKNQNSLNYFHPSPQNKLKQGYGGMAGKVGRNELCPCGSGKKFKKCCLV